MKKYATLRPFLVSMGAFVLCILATGAPLARLAGTTMLATLPTSMLLTLVGTKLPADLHLTSNTHASQVTTNSLEFFALTLLAYFFYTLCAYLAQKYSKGEASSDAITQSHSIRTLLRLIWIGAALLSVIYVLMPAVLSRDALVYAGYGRIIVAHHANPYYVPLSAFPHDPLLQLDDWRDALAAYGPLWLLVCALSTLVADSSVLHYLFFYRIFGLVAHLLNIFLVATILRKTGRSHTLIVMGTLLYAWNPLVLLESCMGGHNDSVMVSCLLLGILFYVHAEQDRFTHARLYLLPIIAFTCAALIKFTAAPVIAFYLVLLARRVLHIQAKLACTLPLPFIKLRKVGVALLTSTLLVVVLYIPLWAGHTPQAIMTSLGSPPSSHLAFGSTLLALQKVALHQQNNVILTFFSKHSTWNIINGVVVGAVFCTCVLWLWRKPMLRTMVYAALATLGALLLVTPWFFPWYVLWLVGLAATSLPEHGTRVGRALILGALTFSASAFFLYLFRGYPPVGDWIGFTSLTTIGPPLFVFFVTLFIKSARVEERQQKQGMGRVNPPVL